jgi:hypothetical protein
MHQIKRYCKTNANYAINHAQFAHIIHNWKTTLFLLKPVFATQLQVHNQSDFNEWRKQS